MPARFWQVLITSMTMRISPDKQRCVTPANIEETYSSQWDFLAAPQRTGHRTLLFYLGQEHPKYTWQKSDYTIFYFSVKKNVKKKIEENKNTILHFFTIIVLWSTTIPPSEIHNFQNASFFLVWEHKFKIKHRMNATVPLMSKQEQSLRVNTQDVHVICPFLKKSGMMLWSP